MVCETLLLLTGCSFNNVQLKIFAKLFFCNNITIIILVVKAGVTKFGPGGPVSLQSLAPTLIKHTWSS